MKKFLYERFDFDYVVVIFKCFEGFCGIDCGGFFLNFFFLVKVYNIVCVCNFVKKMVGEMLWVFIFKLIVIEG